MEAARLERELGRRLLGAKGLFRETITIGGLSAINFSQMQPEERGFRLNIETQALVTVPKAMISIHLSIYLHRYLG